MTLSQTAEHALRAVLFLASQPVGTRVPADVIADALGAPRNYLAKTLGVLARTGVIDSARGPTGGFRLVVPAEELSLARVIRPFGETNGTGVCLAGGKPCDAREPCAAHERWLAVQAESEAPLERTMIADLVGGPTAAGPSSAAGNGSRA